MRTSNQHDICRWKYNRLHTSSNENVFPCMDMQVRSSPVKTLVQRREGQFSLLSCIPVLQPDTVLENNNTGKTSIRSESCSHFYISTWVVCSGGTYTWIQVEVKVLEINWTSSSKALYKLLKTVLENRI